MIRYDPLHAIGSTRFRQQPPPTAPRFLSFKATPCALFGCDATVPTSARGTTAGCESCFSGGLGDGVEKAF